MNKKAYAKFCEDIKATPFGDHSAFNAVWDAAPKSFQRRYKRDNWTLHPIFHSSQSGRFPIVVWGKRKKWYRHFLRRPITHYICILSCIVNGNHDTIIPIGPDKGKCSTCGKVVISATLSNEQEKEYNRITDEYRILMKKKGLGIGPTKGGVILPVPSPEEFDEFIAILNQEIDKLRA